MSTELPENRVDMHASGFVEQARSNGKILQARIKEDSNIVILSGLPDKPAEIPISLLREQVEHFLTSLNLELLDASQYTDDVLERVLKIAQVPRARDMDSTPSQFASDVDRMWPERKRY